MTPHEKIAGLTPEEWEKRLEEAADDPDRLDELLEELDHEMRQETTWVHENPTPGALFKAVFSFFGRHDHNLETLGVRIKNELHSERRLKDRYRTWFPGEDFCDRLFPYLKGFGGKVEADSTGLQFPGFRKYKGIKRQTRTEVFAFFVSERFPGRDPANFHLSFAPQTGELVIERVYKMELPRVEGITTVGRAIAAELVADITPSPSAIKLLVVDNAANLKTREALMRCHEQADGVVFEVEPDCDPSKTPLGHLMLNLALELGLVPGAFSVSVNNFGVMKISLPIQPA